MSSIPNHYRYPPAAILQRELTDTRPIPGDVYTELDLRQCVRCDCPLTRLVDEPGRRLCVRCTGDWHLVRKLVECDPEPLRQPRCECGAKLMAGQIADRCQKCERRYRAQARKRRAA